MPLRGESLVDVLYFNTMVLSCTFFIRGEALHAKTHTYESIRISPCVVRSVVSLCPFETVDIGGSNNGFGSVREVDPPKLAYHRQQVHSDPG